MNKILVSDVFGKTVALISLANAIDANIIIDPYDGKFMDFIDEGEAYKYFTANVTIERYTKKLINIVEQYNSDITLVGFSVGASAIWNLAGLSDKHNNIKGAICYYGSQIRHFTTLSPLFMVQVVFPKCEPHFDVNTLNKKLKKKDNVITKQVDYLHGFMNKDSSNFDQAGYEKHIKKLLNISDIKHF